MTRNRDEIRAALFSSKNKKQAKRVIELFGEKVEIRQPNLAQITKLGREAGESKIPPIVRAMIEYIYIPDTDDHLFDPADAEQIASMPSGKWLTDFNQALLELTGINVEEAEKNSEETVSE